MMNKIKDIKKWKAPNWHKDFGDPIKEMQLLQDVCINILDLGYDYLFKLDCFEEGYLSVEVFEKDDLIFDMQVVNSDEKKIGLFFKNGEEHYINQSSEISKFLK